MSIPHKEWNEIQGRIKSLIAQKGEPFAVGNVVRRDLQRRLVWVTGFGREPIPIMAFNGDIYVYDEWRELDQSFTRLTGSGNFTPAVNTKLFTVEAVGPGGGGAGSNIYMGGMGGAAGGYSRKKISKPGINWPAYPYSCGVGGDGGAGQANGNPGSAATTFGSPAEITCSPGEAGISGNANLGGVGGSASGGDLNLSGGDGSLGSYVTPAGGAGVTKGGGGTGGNSFFGGGGRGGYQAAGLNAHNFGAGGGGGGYSDGGNHFGGGKGSNGVIFITEFKVTRIVQKKHVTMTPRVPEVGDLVLIAHHLGSRELPKCIGVLQSYGFSGYDPGLE